MLGINPVVTSGWDSLSPEEKEAWLERVGKAFKFLAPTFYRWSVCLAYTGPFTAKLTLTDGPRSITVDEVNLAWTNDEREIA